MSIWYGIKMNRTLQIAVGRARSIGRDTRIEHPTRAVRREIAGTLACQPEAVLAECDRQASIRRQRLAARTVVSRWCAGRVTYLAQRRAEERAAREEAARLSDAGAIRRRLLAELRKLGFRRETTSGRSAYYYHPASGVTVRVSDHAVPLTADREWSLATGGRSWANSRLSVVVGRDDEAAWLEDVRSALAARE